MAENSMFSQIETNRLGQYVFITNIPDEKKPSANKVFSNGQTSDQQQTGKVFDFVADISIHPDYVSFQVQTVKCISKTNFAKSQGLDAHGFPQNGVDYFYELVDQATYYVPKDNILMIKIKTGPQSVTIAPFGEREGLREVPIFLKDMR